MISRVLDCRPPVIFSHLSISGILIPGIFPLLVDFGDCTLFVLTNLLSVQGRSRSVLQSQVPKSGVVRDSLSSLALLLLSSWMMV